VSAVAGLEGLEPSGPRPVATLLEEAAILPEVPRRDHFFEVDLLVGGRPIS
jgi:hypothetical protein